MRVSAQYPDAVYFDQDEKQFFASFMWEVEISVYFYSNDLLRILFLTGLAVSAVSDWKYYRIPNWVIVWEMVLGCISLFFSGWQRGNRNLERTVAMVSGGSGSLCIPGSFAVDTGHRSFTFWTGGCRGHEAYGCFCSLAWS